MYVYLSTLVPQRCTEGNSGELELSFYHAEFWEPMPGCQVSGRVPCPLSCLTGLFPVFRTGPHIAQADFQLDV